MYEYDISEVEKLTGLKDSDRKKLTQYYHAQPDIIKIEVHKLHFDLLNQNKNKSTKQTKCEWVYANFLLALQSMQNIEKAPHTKTKITDEELKKIDSIRINRIKANKKRKPGKTKDLIRMKYYKEIKKLKEQDLSWRDISLYIKKYFRSDISHTHLRNCYNEIKKEQGDV